MNKRDVFSLENVYELQIQGNWSTKDDVWLKVDTLITNLGNPSLFTYNTGYFGGGSTGGSWSRVDRIDYSNDTATASPKGPLTATKYYLAATGNSYYGWFGGGTPGPTSTVDRIDYSNDTATASPKGPLSLARRNLAATGNSSFGYFGGGDPGPRSTVDRIDYSNDTATASVRGPLSVGRFGMAAASSGANALPQNQTLTLNPIEVIP